MLLKVILMVIGVIVMIKIFNYIKSLFLTKDFMCKKTSELSNEHKELKDMLIKNTNSNSEISIRTFNIESFIKDINNRQIENNVKLEELSKKELDINKTIEHITAIRNSQMEYLVKFNELNSKNIYLQNKVEELIKENENLKKEINELNKIKSSLNYKINNKKDIINLNNKNNHNNNLKR